MATKSTKKVKRFQVRAKVAHTEPGTQTYRAEGEVFTHAGEVYKHVDLHKELPDPDDEEVEEGDEV